MLQTSHSIAGTGLPEFPPWHWTLTAARDGMHAGVAGLLCLLLATTLALPANASGVKVYKSIDADGNVTYSAEPARNAVQSEQILIEEAPSEKAFNEANQRAWSFQKEAERLDRSRQRSQQERTEARQTADQSVQKAERELAQARKIKDTDWQGLSGGGRVLKESYHQRVRSAETKLEQARKKQAVSRRDY